MVAKSNAIFAYSFLLSDLLSFIDYKWARGFDPQLVHSVHFICDPWLRRAVRQFLESETEYNVAVKQHLLDRSSVADRDSPQSKEET